MLLFLLGVGFLGLAFWRVAGFQIENQHIIYSSSIKDTTEVSSESSEQLISPYFYESTAPVLGDPSSLNISRQGTSGVIVPVGLTKKGAIAAPVKTDQIGWYDSGTRLGQLGTIVLIGHKDDIWFRPAVFGKLDQVIVGDVITLTDNLGRNWNYSVRQKTVYPVDKVPLTELLQNDQQARLVLISCAGRWSWLKGGYTDRIVIDAEAF